MTKNVIVEENGCKNTEVLFSQFSQKMVEINL